MLSFVLLVRVFFCMLFFVGKDGSGMKRSETVNSIYNMGKGFEHGPTALMVCISVAPEQQQDLLKDTGALRALAKCVNKVNKKMNRALVRDRRVVVIFTKTNLLLDSLGGGKLESVLIGASLSAHIYAEWCVTDCAYF